VQTCALPIFITDCPGPIAVAGIDLQRRAWPGRRGGPIILAVAVAVMLVLATDPPPLPSRPVSRLPSHPAHRDEALGAEGCPMPEFELVHVPQPAPPAGPHLPAVRT